MALSLTSRAWPCPRSECVEWALFATRDGLTRDEHIWSCSAGHHGPRGLGSTAAA